MKTFIVTGHVTISMRTEVQARNEAEAKEIASERMNQDLCNQCATADGREVWTCSGEFDGEVEIDRVEKV